MVVEYIVLTARDLDPKDEDHVLRRLLSLGVISSTPEL